MTSRSLRLESFDEPAAAGPVGADHDAERAEREKLSAYEAGYSSGWEDCAAESGKNMQRIGAELERNILDLGFTYHEARNQMLGEVRTMLCALFDVMLPKLSVHALAERVADDIQEAFATSLDPPVELVVSPNSASLVQSLLPESIALRITLMPDASLPDDQAFLRFGTTETSYDFGDLTRRVMTALVQPAEPDMQETVNE